MRILEMIEMFNISPILTHIYDFLRDFAIGHTISLFGNSPLQYIYTVFGLGENHEGDVQIINSNNGIGHPRKLFQHCFFCIRLDLDALDHENSWFWQNILQET